MRKRSCLPTVLRARASWRLRAHASVIIIARSGSRAMYSE
jgi:hypothetical protein